jgi:hypothetical protein
LLQEQDSATGRILRKRWSISHGNKTIQATTIESQARLHAIEMLSQNISGEKPHDEFSVRKTPIQSGWDILIFLPPMLDHYIE